MVQKTNSLLDFLDFLTSKVLLESKINILLVFKIQIPNTRQRFRHSVIPFRHSVIPFRHSVIPFRHSVISFRHSVFRVLKIARP